MISVIYKNYPFSTFNFCGECHDEGLPEDADAKPLRVFCTF
jgi:hypothetical protein